MNVQSLKENVSIHRILGKVEIETVIKRINGKKLKQIERNYLSRSIRPKLIGAYILSEQRILEKIHRPKKGISRGHIIFNLSKYGYELITPYKIPHQKLSAIEDLIAKILIQLPEARFIEAIPIILIKNKVDPYRLLEMAIKYDLKNQIGYLLETSFIIAKKLNLLEKILYLKELLLYLKAKKDPELSMLGQETEDLQYKEFLKKTSPKRIKEWNLIGRYFDESFIENGDLYLR